MSTYLLKNGWIVSGESILKKNVLIKDGEIAAILEPSESVKEECKIIDIEGKHVLPGIIDVHVHFREPGQTYKEDFESGSRSACASGVTTVFDMPNNKPPILDLKDLEKKRKLIAGRSYVNYGLYMGYNGKNIEDINKAENIAGVKVYIANSTNNMGVSVEDFEKLLKNCNKFVVVHAEDEEIINQNAKAYLAELNGIEPSPAIHSKIRNNEAAKVAVRQVCELAKKYDKRVHIAHVSTDEEVEIISEYKGCGVTCEVTPHHLHLTEDDYDFWGNFIKVNPPVRTRNDTFALWTALKSGIIEIIATDHAPHTIEEKEQSYLNVPSGVPGVEMLLPIFLNTVSNDGMTLNELVSFCCENPAKIFGLKNKGFILEGYDADLVVVDMELEKKKSREEILSKCGWSPYEDLSFKGWPVMTFVNGEVAFKDEKVILKARGKEVMFG